jgi:VCBS repeat-containing protein
MVAPLTQRNVSAVFRTFLAAAATLFAVALPAAGATIIGPTDPSLLPGGAPFTPLGAATAYGRPGGQTWSFGAIPYAGQTTVWHGAVRNEVKFTMSGPTFANPGEVMTFDAVNSNLATGTLVFNGSTLMPGNATPVFTSAVLHYQDTAGVNVPVISPASVSVPTDGGVLVVPAAGFRLNFEFFASFTNGSGYSPALDFYDVNTTSGGTAQVSFTAGFYSINKNPTLNTNTGAIVSQGNTVALTAAMLAASDAESGAGQITYTLASGGSGGTVTQGTLRNLATPLANGATFTQADINVGNITYTNNPISSISCQTSDSFQFNLTDGNGGVTPSSPPLLFSFPITIALANLPPAANNASISVALGATFNGTLTATNNDCFTPTFAFSVVTPPTKGSVTINPNGSYTYTATPGQTGGDSFTFNVSDGVLNAAAPGTVTVTIANQAPIGQNQTVTTNEGVAASGTLVAADPDVPASPLTYAIVTNGTKGSAFITNSTTGAFLYTPAVGRMGTDTFTFTAFDGVLTSVPATVTVNIFPQVSAGRAVVSAGAATSGPTSGKNTKLFVVNPANGDFGVLSSGGSLIEVRGVAVETSHNVLAVDAAPALIRVDATTGGQTPLGTIVSAPFAIGVDVEANGNILLALGPGGGVSRRNPVTGAQINAFTDPLLTAPIGVAVAPNGDIYVANAGPIAGGLPQVLRINPVSGATSVVSSVGMLTFPVGIAVGITGTIYVTDAPGLMGGTPPSTLLSIDPVSGAQAIVAQNGLLSKPTSVAVEASGTLLVANTGNGSLVRVDPATLAVTPVASPPEFNGLFGVAVLSTPPTQTGVVSRKTHGASGPFDLTLDTAAPIAGAVTVEPRSIGSGHQIVFRFGAPIVFTGVATAVDAASNPVGTATPVASGNDVVVTLAGIPDNSRATVTLTNVNDTGLNTSVSIGFLVGDVNNSRSVTATDILQVKGRSGQATDATNFRFDLNASGSITASDILAVKGRSGLVLP